MQYGIARRCYNASGICKTNVSAIFFNSKLEYLCQSIT